jgi:hypothetical protein
MNRTVKSLGICLALLVSIAAFAQGIRPLSVSDVEKLLTSVSPQRVAELIGQAGVTFEATNAVKQRLRNGGAENTVLQAVVKASAEYVAKRPSAQPGKSTDPERARLEEENRKLR